MIYIKDDFLPHNLLNAILIDKEEYKEHKTPGKSFWVKKPSSIFIDYISNRISEIEGCKINNILCFFREAKKNQDNEWRIHNDTIIENQKPERAIVLFLSEDSYQGLNGTAFWSHKVHGDTYTDGSVDDFNDLLINDSNDISKWNLKTIIGHKKNRLISYPCNYFHSKYPNEFKNSRQVMVMFYNKNKNEITKKT
mgnify:FL=1